MTDGDLWSTPLDVEITQRASLPATSLTKQLLEVWSKHRGGDRPRVENEAA